MGEGAHTIPDKWQRKIKRHSYEAHIIGGGPPQDCGCAESKMGTGQSPTKEGSLKRITTKPAPLKVRALSFERYRRLCRRSFARRFYEGRNACRNPANLAVALYCGIGSNSLNALVNAFERLHMVRAWNSS